MLLSLRAKLCAQYLDAILIFLLFYFSSQLNTKVNWTLTLESLLPSIDWKHSLAYMLFPLWSTSSFMIKRNIIHKVCIPSSPLPSSGSPELSYNAVHNLKQHVCNLLHGRNINQVQFYHLKEKFDTSRKHTAFGQLQWHWPETPTSLLVVPVDAQRVSQLPGVKPYCFKDIVFCQCLIIYWRTTFNCNQGRPYSIYVISHREIDTSRFYSAKTTMMVIKVHKTLHFDIPTSPLCKYG